jgi:hypothetical protein
MKKRKTLPPPLVVPTTKKTLSELKEIWAQANQRLLDTWTQKKHVDAFVSSKLPAPIWRLWWHDQSQQPLFFTSPTWMQKLTAVWIPAWMAKFPSQYTTDYLGQFIRWIQLQSKWLKQIQSKTLWQSLASQLFWSSYFPTARLTLHESLIHELTTARPTATATTTHTDFPLFSCFQQFDQWIPNLMRQTVDLWILHYLQQRLRLLESQSRSNAHLWKSHNLLQDMFDVYQTLTSGFTRLTHTWSQIANYLFLHEYLESKIGAYADQIKQDIRVSPLPEEKVVGREQKNLLAALAPLVGQERWNTAWETAHHSLAKIVAEKLPKQSSSSIVTTLIAWNRYFSTLPWFAKLHDSSKTLQEWVNHRELDPLLFVQELDKLSQQDQKEEEIKFLAEQIFSRLNDQETFMIEHQKLTSRRLLNVYECETSLTTRPQQQRFDDIDTKLREMMIPSTSNQNWKDHYQSIIRDFSHREREHSFFSSTNDVGYRLMVIERFAWIVNEYENTQDWIQCCPAVKQAVNYMTAKITTQRKRLTWCLHSGQAIVSIRFDNAPSSLMYVQVTTLQMLILLLLGSGKVYSLKTFMSELKLPLTSLQRDLTHLCVERIVLVQPELERKQKKFFVNWHPDTTIFKLNPRNLLQNEKTLNLLTKPRVLKPMFGESIVFAQEDTLAQEKERKSREMSRDLSIQTHLARIMKAKKSLLRKELILACQEAFIQMRKTPITQAQVHSQIEKLITDQIVQRDSLNRQKLDYVA